MTNLKQLKNGVFDLSAGNRIYNTITGKYGRVLKLEETHADYVEAEIEWDDGKFELTAYTPNLRIVME